MYILEGFSTIKIRNNNKCMGFYYPEKYSIFAPKLSAVRRGDGKSADEVELLEGRGPTRDGGFAPRLRGRLARSGPGPARRQGGQAERPPTETTLSSLARPRGKASTATARPTLPGRSGYVVEPIACRELAQGRLVHPVIDRCGLPEFGFWASVHATGLRSPS